MEGCRRLNTAEHRLLSMEGYPPLSMEECPLRNMVDSQLPSMVVFRPPNMEVCRRRSTEDCQHLSTEVFQDPSVVECLFPHRKSIVAIYLLGLTLSENLSEGDISRRLI